MIKYIKLFFISLLLIQNAIAESHIMYAHFIDVGQGDATLLQFPCGIVLIDAGAQDDGHVTKLTSYLNKFFTKNKKYNNTINTIIITHTHIDHTRALREVVNKFTVNNYIDNGQLEGPGTLNPKWLRKVAKQKKISVNVIIDKNITVLENKMGFSNSAIDPISCDSIDPEIRILSSKLDENPGWPHSSFDNKNNHSIVTRVDFGKSSFLFTGDLQEDAIDTLLEYYNQTDILDIDIYQVGHHGSHNATTKELLEKMSPAIAVISMGKWDYGRDTSKQFSTWSYGHPRINILNKLKNQIKRRRSYTVEVAGAVGAKNFKPYKVSKAVYGTGWFGTVIIRADNKGKFRVTHYK
ncbi:hypothetical protein MNBD_GAMMA22-1764 [hydrothermal vent metagenome]|uniref:Metallo-beta-lactamase domain-containing protein n=1 Tax=hydrothermal vent metagenome TaxID=652676 RepID=A0A3B0ZXU7_9ZZZZ